MKILLKYPVLLCLFAVSLMLPSCGDNNSSAMSGVTGKFGEIYVIVDKALWDSEIGDTLRSVFTKEYPMLPQPEAMFKLMSVPYDNFSRAFQRHRNLIIVSTDPNKAETQIDFLYDRWASPQIVVNIVGSNEHDIAKTIYEQQDNLTAYVEQAELDRQTSNAIKYEDDALRKVIEKKYGVRMFIPKGYQFFNANEQPVNFLWFLSRNNHLQTGIFVYTYPFTSDSTFTIDYLVNKRNEFLKQNVPGEFDSTWMITSPIFTPNLKLKEYKGQTYGEMRGLWDVENDFMGGPFISRSYVDNVNRRIVTVEGYVYAPRYDKRDYLRRLEGIINTFTLTIPQAGGSEK